MEMTGGVRRGYFVEGLSGAQFALPEAARLLQETGLAPTTSAPAVLLHSLDPANLYGSGAPLDIPLLGRRHPAPAPPRRQLARLRRPASADYRTTRQAAERPGQRQPGGSGGGGGMSTGNSSVSGSGG